jgi:hypothetical protein
MQLRLKKAQKPLHGVICKKPYVQRAESNF